MVMHRSCSSFLVSVKRVSPALAPAMIPALDTRESVRVDFPVIKSFFVNISTVLTVIDVGNNGHVTDVLFPVHERTDLIDSEVHLDFESNSDVTRKTERTNHVCVRMCETQGPRR